MHGCLQQRTTHSTGDEERSSTVPYGGCLPSEHAVTRLRTQLQDTYAALCESARARETVVDLLYPPCELSASEDPLPHVLLRATFGYLDAFAVHYLAFDSLTFLASLRSDDAHHIQLQYVFGAYVDARGPTLMSRARAATDANGNVCIRYEDACTHVTESVDGACVTGAVLLRSCEMRTFASWKDVVDATQVFGGGGGSVHLRGTCARFASVIEDVHRRAMARKCRGCRTTAGMADDATLCRLRTFERLQRQHLALELRLDMKAFARV